MTRAARVFRAQNRLHHPLHVFLVMRDTSSMSNQPVTRGWIPDDQNLGARLALVRQRFGWNMKEAALACAIPQGSWREWELKDRVPRDYPGMMEKIAARTDVDLMWLMTGRTPGSGDDGSPDHEAGASEKLLRLDSNQQPSGHSLRSPLRVQSRSHPYKGGHQ